MCYHAKPYCPGQRLLGSVRGWTKRKWVWDGDYSTSKQTHWRQSAIPNPIILILLMTAIWSAKLRTAFSCYCWRQSKRPRSGRPRSGLPSLATAGPSRSGDPMAVISSSKRNSPDRAWLRIGVEAENCRLSSMCFVYLSSSHHVSTCSRVLYRRITIMASTRHCTLSSTRSVLPNPAFGSHPSFETHPVVAIRYRTVDIDTWHSIACTFSSPHTYKGMSLRTKCT